MVYTENVGFQAGSFDWRGFQMHPYQTPTYTTGSGTDVTVPLLLVNPEKAWNSYGVNPTHGGSCPKHGGIIAAELFFNSFNRYFYLLCPLDGTVYRYLDNTGKVDDLKVVKSGKTTSYDEEVDVPSYW